MGSGRKILMGMRALALMCTLAVVGLGAFSKFIMRDIRNRGLEVLDAAQLGDFPSKVQDWQNYFNAVNNGEMRTWATIAAAAIASLATILIILAHSMDRMRIPSVVLIPIEGLAMSILAAAFGTSLSFALDLDDFSDARLDPSTSSELAKYAHIVLFSKIMQIAVGAAGFMLLVLTIASTVDACNRRRAKESCSFEPTASSLGIGHNYQTTVPRTSRGGIPTMYRPDEDEEKRGFASEGMPMGHTEHTRNPSIDSEKSIIKPLGLEAPAKVLQIRPSRPWSEAPKRFQGIHAL